MPMYAILKLAYSFYLICVACVHSATVHCISCCNFFTDYTIAINFY